MTDTHRHIDDTRSYKFLLTRRFRFVDRFVDSRSHQTTCAWLWPTLFLAFCTRLAVAFWGDVPIHPDETYQYTEQAFRLLHDYGFVPWEYSLGIRSWLIPGVLAGCMWVGGVLGFDTVVEQEAFLKTVLCFLSLTLPLGLYRLTQIAASERAAIVAFLLGCFWHHFLYYAHKPMPGILATYALIWMMVLMLRTPTSARLWMAGVLSGLILILRYQLVPVLGVLNLFALMCLRRSYLPMFFGNLLVLLAAGLLDLMTWGGFLSSFIDNFRVNFMFDIASNFGTAPVEFYAKRFGVETGGVVLIAAAGCVVLWPRFWPMIVAVVVGIIALHVPAHKEFRFVIWAMPFVLMAAAVMACHPCLPRRLVPTALLIWGAGVSFVFVASYTGYGTPLNSFSEGGRHGIALMREVRDSEYVTGVDITAALSFEQLGGYSTLGHPVPIYMESENRSTPWPAVSHIIAHTDDLIPPGFTRVAQSGPFTLWHSKLPGLRPKLDPNTLYLPLPANIGPHLELFDVKNPQVSQ